MSREHWRSLLGSHRKQENWREVFAYRPLTGRTTDPEALDYDEASELFFQGLKLARGGDLKAGGSQIATAFLLNGRSINFCLFLPDPAAADVALDAMLLCQLVQGDSYGAAVLRIALAQYLGHTPEGQTFIAQAIQTIDNLLKAIEREPKLEAHAMEGGVLGGCLTRKTLLFLRSGQHMAMGNQRKAIKDLTRALEIDPGFTCARDARASLWASLMLKEPAVIHAEYKRIVNEVHKDNRGIEVAYGWLACLTFDDPRLGTLQEAKRYYEKMIRSKARYDELYGHRDPEQEPPVLELATSKFASYAAAPPEMRKFREDCDAAFLSGKMEGLQIPEPKTDTDLLHRCLKCNKTALDIGGKLSKCGRCKKVSYCSRDCQTADWKNHKVFCKAAVMPKPPTQQAAPEVKKEPLITVAKTPIDDLNGVSRSVARMEKELRKLYEEYGKGFADWWHEKSSRQREGLLLDMTSKTLPLKMLKPTQVKADLMQGISSRVCFECNVQTLVGQCGCAAGGESVQMCHYFPDRLLHEVYMRAMEPKIADNADWDMCKIMKERDVLPDLFPGKIVIRVPNTEDGPEKNDLNFTMFTDECPEHVKEKWKKRIEDGLVVDGSVAIYMLNKKVYCLQLLIKLFDEYQFKIRRVYPTHSYERLRGCEYCRQTCDEDGAVSCSTCKVFWWCCQGCQEASEHGRKCPVGHVTESRVLFK